MFNHIKARLAATLSRKNVNQADLLQQIDRQKLPRHVAIIMDGNGRWAKRRGLPRGVGHRAGVESLREAVKACVEIGIEVLTVYAFSTENWKRPVEEVNILMDLLVEYLRKELDELHREGVQVRAIGKTEDLPELPRQELVRAQELTKNNRRLILNVALNYGGRLEITEAARRIARQVLAGRLQIEEINEQVISDNLYTAGLPDPDLLIRPSGEMRVSNYLLWQLAYAEFVMTEVLWPDFRRRHLYEAIIAFQQRDRRYGGLKL